MKWHWKMYLLIEKLIGKLIYLTITWPNISFDVHHLSQFLHAPKVSHYASAKVIKYIKGAPSKGILYKRNASLTLHAYCDVDWADCPISRKFVMRFCIMLNWWINVFWKSKKQTTISRSSVESEYRVMASTIFEIRWLHYFLNDLHVIQSDTMTLHCDNRATIHIANNPMFHERTKHIELYYHFVSDHLSAGLFHLHHTPSHLQVVDVLTKPATLETFCRLLPKLVIYDIHAPAWERGVLRLMDCYLLFFS